MRKTISAIVDVDKLKYIAQYYDCSNSQILRNLINKEYRKLKEKEDAKS